MRQQPRKSVPAFTRLSLSSVLVLLAISAFLGRYLAAQSASGAATSRHQFPLPRLRRRCARQRDRTRAPKWSPVTPLPPLSPCEPGASARGGSRRNGKVVENLKKEDFQLFDNRKPQTISTFSMETPASSRSFGGCGFHSGSRCGKARGPWLGPAAIRFAALR